MLYWNKAGPIPNPVPWCRSCVTQSRRDELQRHFDSETQDPKQHGWSQSERVKMDVRSLKTAGVVYKALEQEHKWAVVNRVDQCKRSAAKNWVRADRVHGREAANDSEILRNLEVIGWTGKDVLQQIETIKSSGAKAVTIRIKRTEVQFLQADMTAETDERELYLELAKQGASN